MGGPDLFVAGCCWLLLLSLSLLLLLSDKSATHSGSQQEQSQEEEPSMDVPPSIKAVLGSIDKSALERSFSLLVESEPRAAAPSISPQNQALCALVCESVRRRLTAVEFLYVLQDTGSLPPSASGIAEKLYHDHFDALSSRLAVYETDVSLEAGIPAVSRIRCRLDWNVQSSTAQRQVHPIYHVQMDPLLGPSSSPAAPLVAFEATKEELIDLSAKLKEALRSAERLAHASAGK